MCSAMCDTNIGRTRGDGMEESQEPIKLPEVDWLKLTIKQQERLPPHRKDDCSLRENFTPNVCSTIVHEAETQPEVHSLYKRRYKEGSHNLPPVVPKGELVPMTPRLVTPVLNLADHKKTKPPRFIPCEPYPGAVNPIIPKVTDNRGLRINRKANKNNLDIALLANQMSTMRTEELQKNKQNDKLICDISENNLLSLQEELKKAREERDYIEGQFKFQAKVNSELKNLLVASVGEDLQTRVNVLTEDKLQLARALLDTANNLTTHTEQIEFLAGQCEVWRSKFLASSVMVEELARWKADLTQKNLLLTQSSNSLLQTMHQLREMQLDILTNLKFLAKIRYIDLPATDVISLSAENLNIIQQMVLHSGVGIPEDLNIISANRNILTESEQMATKALEFTSQPLMATDDAIRALFGQIQRPYCRVSGEKSSDMHIIEHTI